MADSRVHTLILLLVALSLCQSRLEQVDAAFHRKNPETVVRACGDQLFALLAEISTASCPVGRVRRSVEDPRGQRRARSISHLCCSRGCSYEALVEMMCAIE